MSSSGGEYGSTPTFRDTVAVVCRGQSAVSSGPLNFYSSRAIYKLSSMMSFMLEVFRLPHNLPRALGTILAIERLYSRDRTYFSTPEAVEKLVYHPYHYISSRSCLGHRLMFVPPPRSTC